MDRNAAPEQKGSPQFRVLRAGPQAFKLPREKIMTETFKTISPIDGSVFVTCAALNPTSTIQALALRTADHIIETRGARVT